MGQMVSPYGPNQVDISDGSLPEKEGFRASGSMVNPHMPQNTSILKHMEVWRSMFTRPFDQAPYGSNCWLPPNGLNIFDSVWDLLFLS